MRRRLRHLDPQVRRLGLVSLLADLSSELAYPLLPLFITGVLGAPVALLGIIEGLAEATASISKYPFGQAADFSGRRRPLVIGGYALAAVGKLVIALATSWPIALGGRVLDRLGKGMRSAPRDDLLAAAAPGDRQGLAFGLHRAMDTIGAVAGPLLALALLEAGLSLRAIFALAVIPGAASVIIILMLVRERRTEPRHEAFRPRLPVSPAFRWLLLGSLVFAAGNSTDMFLLLKAQETGFSASGLILVYVLYNAAYAAASLPLGGLSDRVGQFPVVVAGYAFFAVVYLGFASADSRQTIITLFAAYGLYIAATDGVGRALIGRSVAAGERASALGLFSTATGLATFFASAVGGVLWSAFGSWATFTYAAVAAGAAAALMLAGRRRVRDALTTAEAGRPAIRD